MEPGEEEGFGGEGRVEQKRGQIHVRQQTVDDRPTGDAAKDELQWRMLWCTKQRR